MIARAAESDVHEMGYRIHEPFELWVWEDPGWRLIGSRPLHMGEIHVKTDDDG